MHLSFSFCITQMRTVLTLRAFLEGLNVFTVMVSAQWPWRVCCLFSHVQLLTSPWIVARQSPLSMGFSRQEYWSGLPFPSPGDLPYPGIKPAFLLSPALAGGFFTASTTWEANVVMIIVIWKILDRNIFSFFHWWPGSCSVLPVSYIFDFQPQDSWFSSHTSQLSVLTLLRLSAPLVYTLGQGLGEPACAWMSHMCPSPSLGRKSFFLSSPFHSLISWNTVLSLRTVNLLSKWTNYTHCASLLFSDLADLLFIAFPKMFASNVPSNPASEIWHWGWKQI